MSYLYLMDKTVLLKCSSLILLVEQKQKMNYCSQDDKFLKRESLEFKLLFEVSFEKLNPAFSKCTKWPVSYLTEGIMIFFLRWLIIGKVHYLLIGFEFSCILQWFVGNPVLWKERVGVRKKCRVLFYSIFLCSLKSYFLSASR